MQPVLRQLDKFIAKLEGNVAEQTISQVSTTLYSQISDTAYRRAVGQLDGQVDLQLRVQLERELAHAQD